MTYPSGPQQPPFQPPKKGMSTGAKIGLGCGIPTALVVLLMGGCSVLMTAGTDTDNGEEATEVAEADNGDGGDGEEEGDAAHQLGDTFEHGSFEFTVHSIEYGVTSIEDEFGLTQEPRGEYAVVELTAENISSSAEYLSGSDQVLMDEAGSMYEYDISASADATFIDQLNPGQAAEATLVYDISEDTEIDHMLVNGESMFEDGVRVDLDT
ncbi:DUF4352 domain-containing protein [Nocardiopsis oceani]